MTSVAGDQSAADLLTTAADHLRRAAAGNDVPATLEAGLRAILAVHDTRTDRPVDHNTVALAVSACIAAIDPVSRYFGQCPLPTTIDFGLRSAGSLAQTLGRPAEAVSDEARELHVPSWVDGTHILLSEMDAAIRWRRIVEQARAAGAYVGPHVAIRLGVDKPSLKIVRLT